MKVEGLEENAVVISGISGKFPKSENINDLRTNLINGEDCVSSDHTRWKLDDFPKIPLRLGTISNLTKFDNYFFGINSIHAKFMAPEIKIALEVTFEAIIDAGINPVELRNKKTNVYGVLSLNELESSVLNNKTQKDGHSLLGYCRGLLANRISFCIGLIGSSCTIDSNSSSSSIAIQKAYEALKAGDCDYAIVSGGALSLLPQTSYQLLELGLLSKDGVNKSFDKNASGFSRSESIGTIFLQRAKHAKRVYAEVINLCVGNKDAIPRNTCLFPTAEFQASIMKQTLKHSGLNPSDITYIEADGTAIKSMDLDELNAIDLVYGQDRSFFNPLLIGSIKSNIGYTLNNNAINSIIKVLIAMETGVIPPNLHYSEPPEEAQCLQDKRVKVITKPTPWTDCYAAVNTAALNGSFSHIILKRHSKEKQRRKLSPSNMPRLFVASCRTQEMISSIFNILKSSKGDDELAQLITDITGKPFPYSLYSGYTVIPDSEAADSEHLTEIVQANMSAQSREIWFVFSGMGSQWTGMGESLMKIPIFAESIKKCDVVLRPRGYDIVHIICDKDPTIYDNIINCFLGIAAIQIGLVDTLYAVGVKPNHMIGHSVGELGCSYADGCFTAEEMILSALSRGLASVKSDLIHGTMAAVGLGYKQIKNLIPEDIDVACHNGSESSTISGPTESINSFVKELQKKGIFAKTVPTGNIAFHSRYISPAGPKLLEYLKKVIPQPKYRSKRWICTSIPKNEWHSMKAYVSSAEYHTNNLLSPVLFEEILEMIPKNAITIEISPHGLLQAILKKSLDSSCVNLSLTKRGHEDNATFILSTLGKLYNLGVSIMPGTLYPRIPYPVSRETPSISSLVRWEHSSDWHVEGGKLLETQQTEELIDLNSDQYKFLQNFKINGNIIISSIVYLKLIVDNYSNLIPNKADNSFILEDIIIYNKILKVPRNGKIHLIIMIFKGSGKFEVKTRDEIMIASGIIRLAETRNKYINEIILLKEETEILDETNIYSNLLLHGYQYEESYNIINGLSTSYSNGTLKWSSDWRLLLDGLIQVHIISNESKSILIPNRIQKLVIDMAQLTANMKENNKKSTSPSRWQAKIDKSGSLVWVEELPLIKEKNNRIVKVKCCAFDLGVYEYWLKNDVSLESQISITEYSGIDEKGLRVMGLVDNFTISNEILPDSDFTWIIPETFSFEEAATIPHAYLAAFCILHSDTWRFKRIKTVLVHYGASDVGQALINLSLFYNFDVYTTYETDAEKRVIESMRPCLPQSNIINVKDCKIDSMIITKGKGFDFVVASYSILDHMEICLDIVKNLKHLVMIYDCKGPNYNPCPLSNFIRFISVYSCCLQDLIKLPQKKKRELAELMRKALQAGTIKPIISRRIMIQGATEERKIAACERYGKVLVHLQEEKKISNFIPQLFFHSDKYYLVIDGFNIFGKVLIEWMIEQGARKLIIVSNISIQGHENSVLKWQGNGATVIVLHEVDLSNVASFDKLLKEALTIGQLDGIFDLQRTKMDSSSSSTNYFKVTQLLDKHSKKLCPSYVKFFIFSSLNLDEDGLRDPNIEKLCTKRNESGHHGLFILLPNFVEKTLTETEFKNVYYTKMSLFLKRLNVILCTDSSVIAVRHIIVDNSVNDNEKNIVAGETNKEQRIDEEDKQKEEIRQFEKYLYNYD
ncbi:hypothetical protein M0804_014115 [Polistes exclamans]|nr:hypothetical protein M0804_014115 [Polistes exclamans]